MCMLTYAADEEIACVHVGFQVGVDSRDVGMLPAPGDALVGEICPTIFNFARAVSKAKYLLQLEVLERFLNGGFFRAAFFVFVFVSHSFDIYSGEPSRPAHVQYRREDQ